VSDWSYVTIAYIVAWGGVSVYALALGRRLFAARRLERRLRAMIESNVSVPAATDPAGRRDTTVPAGWAAEGDGSACDVPPAS
jgi:hypothetical protein